MFSSQQRKLNDLYVELMGSDRIGMEGSDGTASFDTMEARNQDTDSCETCNTANGLVCPMYLASMLDDCHPRKAHHQIQQRRQH